MAGIRNRSSSSTLSAWHGGLGNASRIEGAGSEKGLKMDEVAGKNGFIVAYLNGTPVTRMYGLDKLGWNAGGGCCGVPAENNVDDVGYITCAVHHLVDKYGVDPERVYGMGHSNGGMMTMRLMCETSLYAAAVSVSGPLNLRVQNCPAARGRHILAIHGAQDQNVPIAGGQGTRGLANVVYNSERYTQRIFAASGADFRLQIVQGADHGLDNINDRIEQTEGLSLAEKAERFFGSLNNPIAPHLGRKLPKASPASRQLAQRELDAAYTAALAAPRDPNAAFGDPTTIDMPAMVDFQEAAIGAVPVHLRTPSRQNRTHDSVPTHVRDPQATLF
jgi:dienelactone hydrolase